VTHTGEYLFLGAGDVPASKSALVSESRCTAANSLITATYAFHKSAFRSIAYLRRLDRLDQKVQPLHTVEPWIRILLQRLLWIYAQLRKATQENAERDLGF
jgi:hypothetical protein